MSKSSKEEKKKRLLEYARKIYKKEGRLISKREIRKVFHIEVYNYFKNIFDLYQHLNIEVPLCYCPRDYAKKKIIEFVRERSERGLYPMKNEIENTLKIHIYSYFNGIEDLYDNAGINFKLYLTRKYDIEHPILTDDQINSTRNLIIEHIRENVNKGHYPATNDIQKELNLAFYKYFRNIKDAYKAAGVEYSRICPIILGKNKEIILTEIIMFLLEEMNYLIDRVSIFDTNLFNKGADMTILNDDGEPTLVELKAYRKGYNISKRELRQLKSYMLSEKINKGLFITTSTKVNWSEKNITVIDGRKLISLLKQHNLSDFIDSIKWIQEKRVNSIEHLNKKELKRQKIIEYIKNYEGTLIRKNIEKELHMDLKTYFGSFKMNELIKEIKNKTNSGNDPLCRGP